MPATPETEPLPLHLRVPVTPMCPTCQEDAPVGAVHECPPTAMAAEAAR